MKKVPTPRRERNVRPVRHRHRLPDAPALEWVRDASGHCPRATAIGSHSLLVENHTGILAFSDSRVELDSHAGILRVLGKNLSLSGVRQGALIVRGDISRVELPCDGGEAPDEG